MKKVTTSRHFPSTHHGATEVLDERVIPQLAQIMRSMGWELDEAGHLAPTKEENQ